MRPLLNTLYVTTQGAYLSRDGETVAVRVEHETKLQLPIHTLSAIVCFGQVSCSPFLLGLCGERGVAVSFLTEHGRFLARVQGPVSGNVFLRRQQYRCADDPKRRAALACCIVGAKIANCRTVLLRGARDSELPPVSSALSAAAGRIEHALPELAKFTGLERTRGLEGDAAKTYFASFDQLISASKDSFFFRERSRRPPLDNMNALLSFLYTLLTHDYAAALETVGLDPQVGFLHADRPGRPSLALDLMEEMRPVLADRLALSLVNRRQVQADGFQKSEAGAVLMNDEARKTVLVAYQKRKQEEVRHPFLDEKIPLGMIPFTQSLLLARHLRGDLDQYPGFFWR